MSERIAILLGNGPSVDKFDSRLCEVTDVYGTNFIGVKFSTWPSLPRGVFVTDSSRLGEIGLLYKNFQGDLMIGDERRIVPSQKYTRETLGRDFIPLRQIATPFARRFPMFAKLTIKRRILRDLVFDRSRYSFREDIGFNFGNSVIIGGLQYLVSKGYKKILLSGVDSKYRNSKDYLQGGAERVTWVWHDFVANPRLYMEPHLVAIQIMAEAIGVEIIDCTPDGALRFIKKGNFFNSSPWYTAQE